MGSSTSAPTPVGDIDALITQLQAIIADPSGCTTGLDDTTRQRLKQLTRAASVALEEPFETVQRLVYSLGAATGLPPAVLASVVDYLGAQGLLLSEPGEAARATGLTRLMLAPLFQDAVTHFHDNCLPAFAALDTVLSAPAGGERLNAFQVGQHSSQDFYTWLETRPVQHGAFHRFMEAQFASLPTWLDAVDVAAVMRPGEPDQVAFVDVGGGNGQQIAALKARIPDLQGRVVLQDRPEVLDRALEIEGMEKMSYDYLTEQPIKEPDWQTDARVYYFRQIMHNNDDVTCVRILASQRLAMSADSIVIIDDKCLSDDKPPQDGPGVEYTAALSIAMEAMFNAQERREAHWRALLPRAGLVVKDIRRFTKFEDAVIIAAKQ
ncbi:O-methyltransferase, putative [Cordyceps militaris CM01]|uniref:O-methyltransferase, putative n=1 Tax=Cordyceps militaris (strain CM01) TaxID=983644 RepID=G3JF93_CORMM|nr:O-methyltransferase, putative [Cordyceps militaris CM01]EGX93533.1 O-methyltransferase, putative [Cordyceps militaris CM01]